MFDKRLIWGWLNVKLAWDLKPTWDLGSGTCCGITAFDSFTNGRAAKDVRMATRDGIVDLDTVVTGAFGVDWVTRVAVATCDAEVSVDVDVRWS